MSSCRCAVCALLVAPLQRRAERCAGTAQLAGFQHVCGFNWMTNEQVRVLRMLATARALATTRPHSARQVNLVSASITTAVGAALGMLVF